MKLTTTIKLSLILFMLVLFTAGAKAQAVECPENMVCLTRQAALKAAADDAKVVALEKESEAKDTAISGLRDELNKIRIEFATVSGQNTELRQDKIAMRAMLELAMKYTKKNCRPFSVCLF